MLFALACLANDAVPFGHRILRGLTRISGYGLGVQHLSRNSPLLDGNRHVGGNIMIGIKNLQLSGDELLESLVGTFAIAVAAICVVLEGGLIDTDLDLLRPLIGACRIVTQFPIRVYADIPAFAACVKLRVFRKLTLDNCQEMLFEIVCHGREPC